MSNMELLGQTYEYTDDNLFNIPEDAKYPIFNEDSAKLIFAENEEVVEPKLGEGLFLGEEVQEPQYTYHGVPEAGLQEPPCFDFECLSPKLEDTHYKEQEVADSHAILTADTGNMSFENMVKLTKERYKKLEDIEESENELTNEFTDDQELQAPLTKRPSQKSRFSKASQFEPKPQISQNGGNCSKNTRRRSSRPKIPKSDSLPSEEGSSSPKGISLAKRKDVVNKTLLRSVKRYYTSLFEQFTKENQYTKQERREFWKEYIDEFVKSIFGDYVDSITPESGVTIEEVNGFMAAMIVPNNIKRTE